MSLTIRHQLQSFTLSQQDDFLTYVERIDRATTKQLLTAPRDIALTKDGKLASNGFRLTHLAFKQLCQFAAKGLYGLVADIGSVAINTRSTDQFTSTAMAADIINKVVELRFHVPDGLAAKAMILNAETKTVDGIVGARYHYVPHYQLYSNLIDTLVNTDIHAVFLRGLCCGRRAAITLEVLGSVFVQRSGRAMSPTLYITNSEAGEAGVHMGVGLALEDCEMINSNTLQHTAHTTKDFDNRLNGLVVQAIKNYQVINSKLMYYGARLDESLNVLTNHGVCPSKRRELMRKLQPHAGAVLAETIVRKAIFQGADRTAIPAQVSITDLATRRNRDLVLTLCREGEGRYHTIREALECAAFQIIA